MSESKEMFIVEEGTNKWIGGFPDFENGCLTKKEFIYIYKFFIEKEAVTEERVIAEYPNGGKDVEFIEVQPAEGYWEILDLDGNKLDWPIDETIVDSLDKNRPNKVRTEGYIFHKYDEQEKIEYLEKKIEMEKENQIFMLKNELDSSDYITAKFVDRLLTLDNIEDLPVLIEEFREEYSDALITRQEQRDEINLLEL